MLVFRPGFRFLWALLAFASTIHGQATGPDPINDFCALSGHMMTVVGDMLYIVGGWMLYESRTQYNGRNTVIRSLNISKSFQTSLDSVNYIRTDPLPDLVPGLSAATWWPTSENTIDLALGHYFNSSVSGPTELPDEEKKWSYNILTRNWTEGSITLEGWFQTNRSIRVASGMTRWIPKLKRGYMFGGVFNGESSAFSQEKDEHGGLIMLDAATNVWTNTSTPVGAINEGGLVHLSTATDEVLIQFGGRTGIATSVVPLSKINIYSTNQSKWFTHSLEAGATVPTSRYAFCTVVKSAPDGSSHQIYMFSGLEANPSRQDIKGGPTATSVWVLTIPTFEWVQLLVGTKSTTANPKGRITPSCVTIGEHFVLSYGGRGTDNYGGAVGCDKKANAAFLFDLNTKTWTDQFTPNEGTYQVPAEVISSIGGNRDGGSTRTAPAGGFNDASLSTILSFAITSPTRAGGGTGSASSGTPSSTSAPGPSSTSKSTPIGAIVGGALGGVAFIGLLATGAFIFLRRRSRRQRPEEVPLQQEPDAASPDRRKLTTPPAPVEMFVQPHELDGERVNMVELPAHAPPIVPRVTRVPVRSRV